MRRDGKVEGQGEGEEWVWERGKGKHRKDEMIWPSSQFTNVGGLLLHHKMCCNLIRTICVHATATTNATDSPASVTGQRVLLALRSLFNFYFFTHVTVHRAGKTPVLRLLSGQKRVLCSTIAEPCTDMCNIWYGERTARSFNPIPNFIFIGAAVWFTAP